MLTDAVNATERRFWLLRGLLLAMGILSPCPVWATSAVPVQPVDAAEIAVLVEQLGSREYAVREAATRRLTEVSESAIDQLLAAADQQADLEVALRARWILETVPLVRPTDPPAVADLLDGFSTKPLSEQLKVLSRLIRLEADAGAGPLARLVRIHRSPVISQLAAVVILQEWRPQDPHWPRLTVPLENELGSSQRPAATLLHTLIDFSRVADAGPADAADMAQPLDRLIDAMEQFLEQTALPTRSLATRANAEDNADTNDDPVAQLLRRCVARAALQAGQPERAVAAAAELFDLIDSDDERTKSI
ncbi:MAG: hypothetical protein EBS83_15030, partial [Planctomycetia bacterium]|nr:hypothetical protein [Planctomycetia bacterium]